MVLRPRASLSTTQFPQYFDSRKPQLYNDPNVARGGSNRFARPYPPALSYSD